MEEREARTSPEAGYSRSFRMRSWSTGLRLKSRKIDGGGEWARASKVKSAAEEEAQQRRRGMASSSCGQSSSGSEAEAATREVQSPNQEECTRCSSRCSCEGSLGESSAA